MYGTVHELQCVTVAVVTVVTDLSNEMTGDLFGTEPGPGPVPGRRPFRRARPVPPGASGRPGRTRRRGAQGSDRRMPAGADDRVPGPALGHGRDRGCRAARPGPARRSEGAPQASGCRPANAGRSFGAGSGRCPNPGTVSGSIRTGTVRARPESGGRPRRAASERHRAHPLEVPSVAGGSPISTHRDGMRRRGARRLARHLSGR